MASRGVSLTDGIYKDRLLNTLFDFFKNGSYTDITLLFRNREVSTHKVVLAAASEVFATMLQVDMKEKIEGVVDLNYIGLKDESIDDLMEYIYTGRLNISVENVEELLACANYFMIDRLRSDCCDFMTKALLPSNCIGILSISTKFGYELLKQKALEVIQQNFLAVTNEEEFLHLTQDEVLTLLSSDFLEVPDEDTILKALLKWLHFDFDERSQYFKNLLSCVRIQFLSGECFSKLCSYVDQLCLLEHDHYVKISAEARLAKDVYLSTNGTDLVPVGNNTFPRKCLDTSVVIMTTGGYDGRSCLISSFAYPVGLNKSWGHLAPMLISRHDHGTVSLKNRLFVIGGFNSHKGPLNRAEYFNSVRNEWVEMAPMNSKRKSLGACVYQEKLFVSGGLDGNYNALDSVEYYDFEHEVWYSFIAMNQPRYSHGFVANDKGLFAIGGWKSTTGERFTEGEWRMIAPLNIPRAGATSIIRNNKIYVVGGYSDSRCVSSVEIYHIEQDCWFSGASSRIPRWRAGSAIVNETIYVIGGRDSSWEYLDAVESYDLDRNQWEKQESLPCKIMGLRCSVLNVPKYAIR